MVTSLDGSALRRFDAARAAAQSAALPPLPPDPEVVLIGFGNSGELLAACVQALAFRCGRHISAGGINNDTLGPHVIPAAPGAAAAPPVFDRLVLGREHPRSLLRRHPLLEQRYARLLRGISVLETYPLAGSGGHGFPVIAALDIDLHIQSVLAFLRRALRPLRGDAPVTGLSAMQRLLDRQQRRQEQARAKRVILLGGGAGAFGPAGHVLLPYLVRHILDEQGLGDCELWGVVLGPQAFSGYTPFVRQNYQALIESLDYLYRHGQRRAYLDGLLIDMPLPPYNRLFLFDDPRLPAEGVRVSEHALQAFIDRTALCLHLLLHGNLWATVASHTANPATTTHADDGLLRYLHTARATLAAVDRDHLAQLLHARVAARLLDQLAQRLS